MTLMLAVKLPFVWFLTLETKIEAGKVIKREGMTAR